jgi:ABC-type glycerol-3-phosphate transport system substrate-binding protein
MHSSFSFFAGSPEAISMEISMRKFDLLAALASLSITLAGCIPIALPGGASPAAPESTVTEAAPTLDAPVSPTAPSEEMTGEEENGEVVLTVWTPEGAAPGGATQGGQVLVEQLANFEEAHPEISLETYIKRSQGQGSTLAYLRTAPPVAPDILPDLALLDHESLAQAADEGLIVPIGTLLDPAISNELYPVARALGTVGTEIVGLPYVLEVQHVVYREGVFDEPPGSFEIVLDAREPYVFPAAPPTSVCQTLLAQYLAEAGQLVDEEGQPYLDADILREILTFYAKGREAGIIDTGLFQFTGTDETWALYRDHETNLSTVTSSEYLAGRADVRTTGTVWIPTLDGEPYALATGLSWVIVTQDEQRQAAAMSLINFLMNPVNQGAYTTAANWLPTQPAALAVWGDADPYAEFGRVLLENAGPLPDTSRQTALTTALQDALEEVLLNGMSVGQAVSQAAETVNPPETQAP